MTRASLRIGDEVVEGEVSVTHFPAEGNLLEISWYSFRNHVGILPTVQIISRHFKTEQAALEHFRSIGGKIIDEDG